MFKLWKEPMRVFFLLCQTGSVV